MAQKCSSSLLLPILCRARFIAALSHTGGVLIRILRAIIHVASNCHDMATNV